MSKKQDRVTIFDNGDYSFHVTLQPVSSPVNGQALIVTSQRRESKFPNEEHVRFLVCLDSDVIVKLVNFLNANLEPRLLRKPLTTIV